MTPDDVAFASFEHKWLEANPEQATVAIFLAPAERRRAAAFGTLVHELEKAAFGPREAQVAATKLEWWRRELEAAAAGATRHPIARELFDDERARAIAAPAWSQLIDGALAQLDAGAASALDDSLSALSAFYRPVAAIEVALLGRVAAGAGEDGAQLWTTSQLLHAVAARPDDPRVVPLGLLARHGLTRSALAEAGPARTALLRDYLGLLQAQIDAALAQAARASLGRRVRAGLDRELAARARAAADPAAMLARPGQRRWRSLWLSWNAARQSALPAKRSS